MYENTIAYGRDELWRELADKTTPELSLAMRELSAGTASSLGIIEPMAATLFSAVFLSEIPDVFQFIGIALILGATVLLSRAEARIMKREEN